MPHLTPQRLKEEVSARAEARVLADRAMDLYGVNPFADTKMVKVVRARHLIMWLLRDKGYSLSIIAAAVGRGNHTTVLHGLRCVEERGLAGEAARLDQYQTDKAA